MTAREFLKAYHYDERLITGGYYLQEPVAVEPGDRVGVVMMNLGGPMKEEDVEPFLYNQFMDPAASDLPVPKRPRHWLSRLIAKKRAQSVGEDYKMIGGNSPINQLTREQAVSLETRLNERYGALTGAQFRTYVAMRYWKPSSENCARQMEADGINKVVLLPLYPQYSKTTTGASLVYWKALEEAGELQARPTSLVYEYATHPLYVQALNERICEGLQRFPHSVRNRVHLVFSAQGTPAKEMKQRRDPYCCLVHSTVQAVMDLRAEKDDLPFHVAFQGKIGPAEWLTPSTLDTLKALAEEGGKAVLIIPVAFVSDHIETAYELDIKVREEAQQAGIEHYEVTRGLNSHPLFIEALAEAVAAQVSATRPGEGDGAVAALPQPIPSLPRRKAKHRSVRCHQCLCITEAHCWDRQQAIATPDEVRRDRNAA